jgi:hypothetical protein
VSEWCPINVLHPSNTWTRCSTYMQYTYNLYVAFIDIDPCRFDLRVSVCGSLYVLKTLTCHGWTWLCANISLMQSTHNAKVLSNSRYASYLPNTTCPPWTMTHNTDTELILCDDAMSIVTSHCTGRICCIYLPNGLLITEKQHINNLATYYLCMFPYLLWRT